MGLAHFFRFFGGAGNGGVGDCVGNFSNLGGLFSLARFRFRRTFARCAQSRFDFGFRGRFTFARLARFGFWFGAGGVGGARASFTSYRFSGNTFSFLSVGLLGFAVS